DESGYAREVAAHLGTNHHEFTCTIREAMDILPDLPWIFDEPFGDSSAIPTTLVSRIARKHVTVALSADAGDELFAGYPRHRKACGYLARLNRIPSMLRNTAALGLEFTKVFHPAIAKPDRLEKLRLLLKSEGVLQGFHLINQTFTEKEIKRIVKGDAGFLKLVFDTDPELKDAVEPLNKILAVEYKSYLVDDILQKVDRSTMSASLEGREPFLDHRLVEWVAAMPSDYKLKDGVSKRILKDIVHQYVPREMMDRPKMGFGVPVKDWLKHELRDLFEEVMGEELLKRQDCLNTAVVLDLKRDYLEGRLGDFERLWFVFVFLQWYKKWMT
ncbi:MAG: asparagine synthase C-terminal domain-containing protein, partial [Bacteroidia bacterium]|nr:asparagine synthase C-terminal domain-containing protein [Bacteroidia bacterium]